MGRWHAGVIDALGSFLAGMLYDASEDAALEHLERAMELKPDSKTIVLESATGLLILDDGDARARDLLMRGIGMDSRNVAEALLHAEVIERLETLDSNPLIRRNGIETGCRRAPMDGQENRDGR